MTKRIYGGYDVTHNATALGNRTVQSIDSTALFDVNGNMNLDGYTTQELNEIISVLPLSHYGTHTYLPAGVNGDFVGASENSNYRRVMQILEDDGTLVILRPGTNGSSIGLYYSYIPDVLNATSLSTSVNTTEQYMPGYLAANLTPISVTSTDENIIVGEMYNSTTSAIDTNYFTSLTNGTYDDTQHVGFLIPKSTVCPDGGQLLHAMQGLDGYIYYYGLVSVDNSFDISLVRVLFNRTNGTYTSTRISGFNGSIFYPHSNSQNLHICNKMTDLITTNQPYMVVPPSSYSSNSFMVQFDVFARQDTSGNIRVRINGDAWVSTTSYNTRPQHGFSFVFNPNTKAVNIDSGYVTPGQPPILVTDTGSSLIPSGNVISDGDILYNHLGSRNVASTYSYTTVNSVICISTENLQLPPLVQSVQYNQNVSQYNMLNYKQYTSSLVQKGVGKMYGSFGSVIATFLTGMELLPGNTTKQLSTQSSGNIGNSYALHKPTPNFQFGSVSLGTMMGYEPTTTRVAVANNNTNKMFISSIDGAGTVTTNGGVFILGVQTTTPLSYTSTLGTSGAISVDITALTNLKNSEFAKMSAFPMSPSASKDITLYVPQQSNIPAIAILSTAGTDLSYIYRVIEVNVNTRTGNITTLTYKRDIIQGSNPSDILTAATGYVANSSTGMTIYDGGSFYFLGFSDPLQRGTIGNTIGFHYRAIVDKASGQVSNAVLTNTWTNYTMGAKPGALPGRGFGLFYQADLGCKIVFESYGTTIADYNAWSSKATPINVVSQDVAQGFIVYFTEETPVLLSGKSFTLSPTSVDLTTITPNPANKTFHIYVRMEQGLAKYFITENVIAETGTSAYNLFWIGTVTTNALQIDSINVKKRSRLDVFGESLEAAGSSFPVSYGLPSSNGTMNW